MVYSCLPGSRRELLCTSMKRSFSLHHYILFSSAVALSLSHCRYTMLGSSIPGTMGIGRLTRCFYPIGTCQASKRQGVTLARIVVKSAKKQLLLKAQTCDHTTMSSYWIRLVLDLYLSFCLSFYLFNISHLFGGRFSSRPGNGKRKKKRLNWIPQKKNEHEPVEQRVQWRVNG